MKIQTTLLGLLLATVGYAAGAGESEDSGAADLEHASLELQDKRRGRSGDELEWRDFETSDRGTTFRDYWKTRQWLEKKPDPPEQAAPNLERAAEHRKTNPADSGSAETKAEPRKIDVLERSESVRKLKEKPPPPDSPDLRPGQQPSQ